MTTTTTTPTYTYGTTSDKAAAHRFADRQDASRFTARMRGRIQEASGSQPAYIVELRPWVWAVDVKMVGQWVVMLGLSVAMGAAFAVSI